MAASPSRWVPRLLFFTAALVLACEEWIWDNASAVLRQFGRLLPFRWIEGWVRRRTPAQALALFVLPVLVVLPLKGVALGAVGHGHLTFGVAILFLDKVIGTAVFARLWQLTEPALTTYNWIRRGRDGFLRLRRRLYGWLHQQPAYRRTRALLARLKRRGGIVRRFRATLRRMRQLRRTARVSATANRQIES